MTDHDPSAMPPPAGVPVEGPDVPTPPPPVPWWRRRFAVLPLWAWLVLLAVGVAGSVVSLQSGSDDAAPLPTTQPFVVETPDRAESAAVDVATAPTAPTAAPSTSAPEAASATESTPIATEPDTTEPDTTTTEPETDTTEPEPTTTEPEPETDTTEPETDTTEREPDTTEPETDTTEPETDTTEPEPDTTEPEIDLPDPVTVAGPNGESLTIVPRRGPCRYGDLCLVVGFEVTGLPRWPPIKEYTCEFSSGARYWFRFSGTSVETACSSADIPESITVTVAGIRSEMVFVER